MVLKHVSTFQWDWLVCLRPMRSACLLTYIYLLIVNIYLTSQAGPFNLLERIHANLGENWASQDIAGAYRSLRFEHYANG